MSQYVKLEDREFWDELVSNRNRYSLRDLAKKYDCTTATISKAFRRNGIQRKAARSGPKPKTPSKKGHQRVEQALEPYRQYLGVWPDTEIARKADISVQAVTRRRKERGIGKASRKTKEEIIKSTPGGHSRVETALRPYLQFLGIWTDTEIARKADISVQAVTRRRKEKGLGKASRKKNPAPLPPVAEETPLPPEAGSEDLTATPEAGSEDLTAAPEAVPETSTEPEARFAFRVAFRDERVRVMVGPSLSEVVSRAAAHGRVMKIEELAEVLD